MQRNWKMPVACLLSMIVSTGAVNRFATQVLHKSAANLRIARDAIATRLIANQSLAGMVRLFARLPTERFNIRNAVLLRAPACVVLAAALGLIATALRRIFKPVLILSGACVATLASVTDAKAATWFARSASPQSAPVNRIRREAPRSPHSPAFASCIAPNRT